MGREFLKNGIKRVFSGTAVVTVAFLINGVFSYLLQLFLGRQLSIEDYGTFNALLSVFYLLSVPSAVLALSVVKVVSELLGEDKRPEITKLFWSLSRNVVIWGSGIVLLIYFFRNSLASYLNISEPILFLFLGLYILATFLTVPAQSYLMGLLLFNKFAVYVVFLGVLRFIIPVTFVYFGYKVGGVYTGLSLALIISFLLALFFFKKDFVKEENVEIKQLYKKLMNFSMPVLLIQLSLMALTNMDVILVKKYFLGSEAGYYSGVVTLGKIILFGAGSVTMVMFPEISALKSAGKEYMKRFKFFIIFQLALVLPATALFIIFPRFFTLLFFGNQFYNSIQYLPMFSIFISLYVLANFMISFFLAINKTNVFALLLVPIILQFVLININHESLYQVIWINIASTLILLVSLSVYLYKVFKETAPV